jgi:hypothetical protein
MEEGQPLLGNHGAFRSWHACLHAGLFDVVLPGVLLRPLTLPGQGLQLRGGLTFFGSSCSFKFISASRAGTWIGDVSAATISTYTCHSQSNVIMFEGQKRSGTQRRV